MSTKPHPPRRVGIYGGTFDPVHIGHLVVAEELRYRLNLDEVVFVPSGHPPHKPETRVARPHQRLAMLEIAVAGYSTFSVSRVEVDRVGPSYTVDTLTELRSSNTQDDLWFLMGIDAFRDLPTWRAPDRVCQLARIGVATRPDVRVNLRGVVDQIPDAKGRVRVVAVPAIDIASSDIRRRIATGEPFRAMVPPGVSEYISTHQLYRT